MKKDYRSVEANSRVLHLGVAMRKVPCWYCIAFLTVVAMLVLLLFGLVTCGGGAPSASEKAGTSGTKNSSLSQVVLEVPTISCWTCEPRVAASAKSVPGVRAVEFDGQTVTVTYNPEQTTPEAIVEVIEAGGDRVTKVTKP